MPLEGFPLTNRIRFQFDEAPTAWRVRKRAEGLRGSPQASLALHADGERLERPKQRQAPRRATSHCTKGTPGRTTSDALDG